MIDPYKKYNYWRVRFKNNPTSSNYLKWYFNYFYPVLKNKNGYMINKYGMFFGRPPNFY